MIPQIITASLFVIGIVYVLVKHGEPKEPSKSPVASSIVGCSTVFLIAWWGGFFSNLFPLSANDWPQIIWIVLHLASFTLGCMGFQAKKTNAVLGIPVGIAMQYIYYAGGFYDCFFR